MHYIPVHESLSDLQERMEWADANPKRVREMRQRAALAGSRVHMHEVACFWWQILTAITPASVQGIETMMAAPRARALMLPPRLVHTQSSRLCALRAHTFARFSRFATLAVQLENFEPRDDESSLGFLKVKPGGWLRGSPYPRTTLFS